MGPRSAKEVGAEGAWTGRVGKSQDVSGCPGGGMLSICTHSRPQEGSGQQEFVVVQSLSRVRLSAPPWTAARQASLSIPTPGACSNSLPSSR